jgi:NADH-quinone oxidoreductase subunit G
MPDVTLVVDGRTVTVPAGTNIVEAARAAGVAIPVFCYHPKLKPVGMCRMCLVEVYTPRIDPATRQPVLDEQGKPVLALMMNKLQPGCVTPVSDGMVVKTTTDKVQFAQRGQLEFLLTSHPLDCPVCDKGGECPLQNLTMQWGPGNSRFAYSDKIHFEKPIPLGDLIYLDRERCILCSRCVRFQDEIADDPVLGFDNRGRAWEIISKSDPPFDSKFSGNTTDICPVGALTSSDFRFKARVWELRSVPGICTHCPVGCNLSYDMRYEQLMRVMPRENDTVNEIWLCDRGRYGMRFLESGDRLTTPLVRRGGELVPASWDEALHLIADRLSHIRATDGGAALAGLAGPELPNEDLYLFQKLFRDLLGSNNIDHRPGTPLDAPLDTLAAHFGVGKGTDLSKLGKGAAVLVLGADVEEEGPLYKLRLRGIAQRGGDLTVAGSLPTTLDRSAARVLRIRPGTEAHLALALIGAILDEQLENKGFLDSRVRGSDDIRNGLKSLPLARLAETAGVAEERVRAAARAFAQAEHGIIVYGRAALAAGPAAAAAIANLALVAGKTGRANSGVIGLLPGGNSRGALDMGVRPDLGRPGLAAREMWPAAREQRLRGMLIIGMDPAGVSPATADALDALEFLAVQDLFLTETARRADVVLPMAANAEREGSFTNAERRVQRSRQARSAPGNALAPWQAISAIARLLPQPVAATPGNGAKKAARGARAGALPAAQATERAVSVAVLDPPAAPGWSYLLPGDIAEEISRAVPGYAGTDYTSHDLSRHSWGRQPNEAIYYDGTSYANPEGNGIQLPARADDGRSTFSVVFTAPEPPASDDGRPFILLMPARLYDGGDWMRGSKLLARAVPPHAILSPADAARLGVALGEQVRITAAAGETTLPIQIDRNQPEGVIAVPAVRGVDPAALLDGPLARVSLAKAAQEGAP